jgi:hypothetical protein
MKLKNRKRMFPLLKKERLSLFILILSIFIGPMFYLNSCIWPGSTFIWRLGLSFLHVFIIYSFTFNRINGNNPNIINIVSRLIDSIKEKPVIALYMFLMLIGFFIIRIFIIFILGINIINIYQSLSFNFALYLIITYFFSLIIQLIYKSIEVDFSLFSEEFLKSININNIIILGVGNIICIYYDIPNKILLNLGVINKHSPINIILILDNVGINKHCLPLANIDIKYYENNNFMEYLSRYVRLKKPNIFESLFGKGSFKGVSYSWHSNTSSSPFFNKAHLKVCWDINSFEFKYNEKVIHILNESYKALSKANKILLQSAKLKGIAIAICNDAYIQLKTVNREIYFSNSLVITSNDKTLVVRSIGANINYNSIVNPLNNRLEFISSYAICYNLKNVECSIYGQELLDLIKKDVICNKKPIYPIKNDIICNNKLETFNNDNINAFISNFNKNFIIFMNSGSNVSGPSNQGYTGNHPLINEIANILAEITRLRSKINLEEVSLKNYNRNLNLLKDIAVINKKFYNKLSYDLHSHKYTPFEIQEGLDYNKNQRSSADWRRPIYKEMSVFKNELIKNNLADNYLEEAEKYNWTYYSAESNELNMDLRNKEATIVALSTIDRSGILAPVSLDTISIISELSIDLLEKLCLEFKGKTNISPEGNFNTEISEDLYNYMQIIKDNFIYRDEYISNLEFLNHTISILITNPFSNVNSALISQMQEHFDAVGIVFDNNTQTILKQLEDYGVSLAYENENNKNTALEQLNIIRSKKGLTLLDTITKNKQHLNEMRAIEGLPPL